VIKRYNQSHLTQLMQAAEVKVMCSVREGSPQIIKESILHALPIISNDVGEDKAICEDVDNCFIVEQSADEYIKVLDELSHRPRRIQYRERILQDYDNTKIADKIYSIYQSV